MDHVLIRPTTSPLDPRLSKMKRSRTGKGDAPCNGVARGNFNVAIDPSEDITFGRCASSINITLGSFSIRKFILLELAGTTKVAANASA